MDVSLVVIEIEGKDGMLRSSDDFFRASAAVTVNDKNLQGIGEHVDQKVAEDIALWDLKEAYKIAFPPQKVVITKTISVDFDV